MSVKKIVQYQDEMMSRDSFVRTPNETVLHLKPINFVFCLCPDDANYVTEMVNT